MSKQPTLRDLVIEALKIASPTTIHVFVDVIHEENEARLRLSGKRDNFDSHPDDCRCAYHEGNG